MSDLFSFGEKILSAQPFSELLGAQLVALEPGSVELAIDVRFDHKQQHGFVHGGVLSYLADNALTYAGGSILGNAVTSEFKINYLRPALGERIIARAQVLASGKRQAVCECRIYALHEGEELLVAAAQGTIAKVIEQE